MYWVYLVVFFLVTCKWH